MKLNDLKHKKILIAGYGREGKSVHKFLVAKGIKGPYGIADDALDPGGFKEQEKYDIAIRSPSIPVSRLKIPHTTVTNIYFANSSCMTIGVTGTKGKSTTTSLIYAMLKENGNSVHIGGNIGKPLTEILSVEKPGDICVCELSSYQLEDIESSPHITVFLNFFPEHMDHHGDVQRYWLAKTRIAAFVKADDYFIYNDAYPELTRLADSLPCHRTAFISKLPFPEASIPLLGRHNVDNVRAASTVGQILNISPSITERAVKSFKPLQHRLEYVGTFKGISFYDDAISTTPQSTMYALEAIDNIGTLFLGGLDRGYDFSILAKTITSKRIPNIVLFPTSGQNIRKSLQAAQYPGKIFETNDMEKAVSFAYENTMQGSAVVLSCASPSYSIWKNFEEKGDLFQMAVKKYNL